ncbi:DUF5057 domain-containing protein [Bacillus sp. BGMRC 2118]|nr:DUF5057 domain-containing protein [Bacillus sp. BGMRC 2118]
MMRKSLSYLLIVLLIIPQLHIFSQDVNAQQTDKFQLLVIYDQNKVGMPTFPTTTMDVTYKRMKEFVASREQLDGLYDGIYIHTGSYSSDIPRINPPLGSNTLVKTSTNERITHYNTFNRMNDITKLKANEIIEDFIEKDQPVVLHSEIFNQSCSDPVTLPLESRCVLRTSFTPYSTQLSKYQNLKIYSSGTFPTLQNSRPKMNLESKPVQYVEGTNTTIYKSGDEIEFTFSLDNISNESNVTAKLYIDTDFNSKFDSKDLIVEKKLSELTKSDQNYTLTYQNPKGFSGIRIWKLEVIDTSNQNKLDYETGVFRYNGEKVQVKVLQITKDGNYAGNLQNVLGNIQGRSNDGKTIETDIMKITIDVDTLNNFNNNPNYSDINGKYNMLIFGFQDEYGAKVNGAGNITPSTAQKVKKFLETNQSVFFTHDTLRRDRANGDTLSDSNEWFRVFMDSASQTVPIQNETGQTGTTPTEKPGAFYLETNLGRGGTVVNVSKAKKVNDGLRTTFPYDIEDIDISSTHAQYFALNLNNPDVMPWYNLKNDNLDSSDSWNQYYAYSVGSLTYSGAGHTNSSFKEGEQKLFVNLMYQSFLGANHAPLIDVYTPQEEKSVKPYKDLDVVYKLEDLDLNDFQVKTKVYVKGKDIPEDIPYDEVYTGTYIHKVIDRSYLENRNSLTLVIEAIDQSGAKTIKEVPVSLDLNNNLVQATRSFAGNNTTSSHIKIKTNEPTTINYQVVAPNVNAANYVTERLHPFPITDLTLEVGDELLLPNDDDKNGSNKIHMDFKRMNDIYDEVLNGYSYKPSDYRIGTILDHNQDFYNGNKYGQWKDAAKILEGKTIAVPVITKHTDQNNHKDDYIIKSFAIVTVKSVSNQGDLTVEFKGYQNDYKILPTLENIKIEEEYPSNIEVITIPEGFEKRIVSGKTIVTGSISPFTYNQSGQAEQIKNFSIKIKAKEKGFYMLDKSQLSYDSLQGKVEIVDFDNLSLDAYVPVESVTITDPDQLLTPGSTKLLTAIVNPSQADPRVIWSSSNSNIVEVDQNGTITTKGIGTVTITARSFEDPTKSDSINVTVRKPIESISISPNQLVITKGTTVDDVRAVINPSDATYTGLNWNIRDTEIASVTGSGIDVKVTGNKLGETELTVTSQPGNKTDTISVIVIPNLSIDPSTKELYVGESHNFNIKGVNDSKFTWTVSDPSIADITQSGNVTAKQNGTTKVIATYKDYPISVEATLTVKPILESISLPETINIKVGDSVTVVPTVSPGTASDYTFTWEAEKPTYATVSNTGTLLGIKLGVTEITVTEIKTGKSASATVNVIEEYSEEHPPLNEDSARW